MHRLVVVSILTYVANRVPIGSQQRAYVYSYIWRWAINCFFPYPDQKMAWPGWGLAQPGPGSGRCSPAPARPGPAWQFVFLRTSSKTPRTLLLSSVPREKRLTRQAQPSLASAPACPLRPHPGWTRRHVFLLNTKTCRYLVPVPDTGTRHQVPSIRCQVPGAGHLVPSTITYHCLERLEHNIVRSVRNMFEIPKTVRKQH